MGTYLVTLDQKLLSRAEELKYMEDKLIQLQARCAEEESARIAQALEQATDDQLLGELRRRLQEREY